MINTTYHMDGRFEPNKIEYTENLVIIRSNIRQEVFSGSTGSSFTQYFWDEQRYSYPEYVSRIDKEKQQQWDAIEYLLKQVDAGIPMI